MKKYITLIILIIISIGSLIFTYNNDFIYKDTIMKITSIEEDSSFKSSNSIGFVEEHKMKKITGTITNGKHKGSKKQVKYEETYSSIDTEKYKVGDKVFINAGEITGLKRDFYVTIMISVFVLTIYLVGKKKGLLSFLNVAFNSVIFYFGLELYQNGVNLILLCFLEAIFFTIISLLLVTGRNKKTYCAIISTIVSLCILLGLLFIINLTGFKGINFNQLGFLTVPPETVFFASLLIGGLGAIMDVSITMSSSISEILEKNPHASTKDLKESGMEIGKDIMSTMISVLFFTYLSGELPILVLALRNGFGFFHFIFSNFGLEITRFLIGAICIVMTIPISNYIAIRFFKRGEVND